jgi:hypothetical protein
MSTALTPLTLRVLSLLCASEMLAARYQEEQLQNLRPVETP